MLGSDICLSQDLRSDGWLVIIAEARQKGRTPSHVELVAGKTPWFRCECIDPLASLPFSHNIKLLLLKLYMIEKSVVIHTDHYISHKKKRRNTYYYENSVI